MKTIHFIVNNRKITRVEDVNYAGYLNVDTFEFIFDEEWNNLDKTLVLIIGDNTYNISLLNNKALLPNVTYSEVGIVSIGLFGTQIENGSPNVILSTLLERIRIQKGSYSGTEPTNLPEPTQWDLYVTEINNLLNSCRASATQCANLLNELNSRYETYIAEFNEIKSDIQGLNETAEGIYNDIVDEEGSIDTKIANFNLDYNSKVSAFDSNAETKTSSFNSNATNKTNAFDTNASNKTTSFDNNYTTKKTTIDNEISSFNTSYEQKYNDFNSNANSKTTSFNNNYNEKLGNINTAGNTQVGNVNTAGSTQVSAVNTAGSTQVGNIESAGTTQTNAVNGAGDTQVANVNQAGTTQVTAVNTAGQNKIDAINSNQTVQQVENHESRLRVLEKKDGRTYTVIRKTNSNSSSAWTRADDALGLVANARIGSSEAVQNDFDNIYPWCDIKDCNVDSNGEPTHFIGESGFTRDEEVYVYIPKHWIHREKYTVEEDNTENTYEKISIYDYNAPGSIEIAPYMVGKYHTSKITVDDTEVHVSKTGLEPLNSTTKSTFRTKARAKGSKWGLLDWHIFDLQYLYLVEYADYNCETKVGAGFIYGDIATSALEETSVNRIVVSDTLGAGFYVGKTISIGTDRGNYSIARSRKITAINDYSSGGITGKEIVFDGEAVDTTTSSKIWCSPEFSGTLNSFGNYSGCLVNDQKHTVIYRGIENLWGLEYQHVDGINIKDYVAYLSTDYTAYANDKFDGTYSAVGYTNATNNDSYIKEMGFDTTCASDNIKTLVGLPILTGGSSTTYVCDSYWSGTGNKIFCVGGSCYTSGSKYGLFASSCNGTSSYSHWYYGSRLLIHTSQ